MADHTPRCVVVTARPRTTGRIARLRGAQALVVAASVCLAAISGAYGQDRYRLDEQADEWILEESVDPESPEGMLAEARRALAENEPRIAEALATNWIERHKRHPSTPDACLIRADALMAQREYYKALFDYEYIARAFPGSEAFTQALQREYEIASMFAAGTRRKLWGLRWVRADREAEELFIRIQERMPGSRLAELSGIALADFYFDRSDMEMAVEAYDIFLENYPDSEFAGKARRRLIYANLALSRGAEYDARGLVEARTRLEQLIVAEPAIAHRARGLIEHIKEKEAEKLLTTAQWYERTGDPIAAELTVRRVVKQYPQTVAARKAAAFGESLLPRLAPLLREEAPDYGELRRAFDAENAPSDGSAGNAAPSDDGSSADEAAL